MSQFHVELKRTVDDSYDIETGYFLEDRLISDIRNGLAGNIRRFAVITDSIVKSLYAEKLVSLLQEAGYDAELFFFEAGEKNKTRQTKEQIKDAMLAKGFRRDC